MCIIDCLSTIVFILPLHLDYTKVIILILWWRNFQLEYWRTFQLVSTILIDLFIASVISGFRPHVTGRGNSHEIWHNLAMFHVLGSVLFPVAIIFHMATHWD